MALCHVCRRQARGFGINPALRGDSIAKPTRYCSMEHMHMVDPTANEIDAMMKASAAAGEYLESIEQTNLADLSPDEWMTFIEAVCTGFTDHLASMPTERPA